MSAKKRNRARILTPNGLQKLQSCIRERELADNAGYRYSLEKLGELTGLDPGTVAKILDRDGSDKRSLNRCFQAFRLTLEEDDHISVVQVQAPQIDPNFVGREGAIADLNTLVSRGAKIIAIQARGGVGKTTLARRYLRQEFDSVLEFPIAKETKDIASIESLLEEKLRQLGEEPGREFLVSLDRLKHKLQAEPIGILIDNLEPALDSAGKFIEPHRRYVELLRVLVDPAVQSMTLITSRERLRESSVTVQHYLLKSLDITAWEQFFQNRGLVSLALDGVEARGGALPALHNAYGGNAKAMEILSSAITEDFMGDVEVYWQANQDDLFVERDLEDLVTQQINRLQQLDPEAYKLLSRMGCYRYQDVPTVPIEGLFCLLWDVPESRHRRVIKSLQDRSLIEFENGEYWLHPVIRAETIPHIRKTQDWENPNQIIAEFWSQSVERIKTEEDALKAFEAYYHYLDISQYDNAGEIILKRRPSKWHGFHEGESLHGAFIRLGLLNQISSASLNVVEKITSRHKKCRLYHYIASDFRFMGCISDSIKYSQKCINLALDCPDHSLEYTEVLALINLGNCEIDLWNLEQAEQYFQQAINRNIKLANNICCFRLAFLYACLNDKEKTFNFAEKSYKNIHKFGLNLWGKGYRFLSLGFAYRKIEDFEKSLEMYKRAIKFSQDSRYTQVEGVALYGLAELLRDQNKFEDALSRNKVAVKLLAQIGTRCELAEAYYQLGLTYKAMSEVYEASSSFHKSIQIFNQIEAPRQSSKVREAMQIRQADLDDFEELIGS
ncbi:MAG: AAA family ATPase [Leptolyngbyaceae cyanobacterium MO_188.B28]|nr:AAA family ATPase [Leptolyngbyaceae cyanobacterium MO_188.B28]